MSKLNFHRKKSFKKFWIKRYGSLICFYCKTITNNDHKQLHNSTTIDHFLPISKGGDNSIDNLVIACYKCNFSKGNKIPY